MQLDYVDTNVDSSANTAAEFSGYGAVTDEASGQIYNGQQSYSGQSYDG